MHVFGTPKLFLTPPNSPPCTIHFKGQEIKLQTIFQKCNYQNMHEIYQIEMEYRGYFLDISTTTDYDREINLHN